MTRREKKRSKEVQVGKGLPGKATIDMQRSEQNQKK